MDRCIVLWPSCLLMNNVDHMLLHHISESTIMIQLKLSWHDHDRTDAAAHAVSRHCKNSEMASSPHRRSMLNLLASWCSHLKAVSQLGPDWCLCYIDDLNDATGGINKAMRCCNSTLTSIHSLACCEVWLWLRSSIQRCLAVETKYQLLQASGFALGFVGT